MACGIKVQCMKYSIVAFFMALTVTLYPGSGYGVGAGSGRSAAVKGSQAGAGAKGSGSAVPGAMAYLSTRSAPKGMKAPGGGAPSNGFFTGIYDVGSAANGIGFSRHNLGKYGGIGQKETTFDICVYCHTPHRPSDKGGPSWSGKGGAPDNFTAYGTSARTVSPSTVGLGSPSLACLSCHDGSTAFDSVANSPGKKKKSPARTPDKFAFLLTESTMKPASLPMSARLIIGPNMTDDHPVNVLFRGGKYASLRSKDTVISQINLVAGLNRMAPISLKPSRSNLWSIKGFISDTATINDLLRDGRIECSSCHDPHFNNKSWKEVGYTFKNWDDMDGLFLRRVGGNFSSGVCRTCHEK